MPISLPIACGPITLRQVQEQDIDDLKEYYTDPKVARFQFWGPMNDDQVHQLVTSQSTIQPGDPGVPFMLVAVLNSERRVIGDCSLTITNPDNRQADLGYVFNPQYHGRGLATAAVRGLLGFGFQQLNLHRIVATTDVRNERSWRLLERVGMRREARFVHNSFIKGEWVDDFVYAMLDNEWIASA